MLQIQQTQTRAAIGVLIGDGARPRRKNRTTFVTHKLFRYTRAGIMDVIGLWVGVAVPRLSYSSFESPQVTELFAPEASDTFR